jgi:BON domain
VAEQVYDALNADPTYFFRHVDAQVDHGVVTLGGYVWSTPAIYRAEKIAARVPAVTRVVGQMELERDELVPHAQGLRLCRGCRRVAARIPERACQARPRQSPIHSESTLGCGT